jgi:lipopolysaccharide/colanic/teichoic acid biosynthesis glycosyltransferase
MSDLEPRRRSGLSRRSREQRAFTLVLATGVLTVLTFVLVVLAIATSLSLGPAIITALLTGGSLFLLRRTMRS